MIGRDGEVEALGPAPGEGVDADDAALAIEQRAAAVAAIDCRSIWTTTIAPLWRMALTTPRDTEFLRPNGLPIASTSCPGRSLSAGPSSRYG